MWNINHTDSDEMTWEAIGLVLGAIGGLEGLRYLLNLKANRRTENAKADGAQLQTLKDTNQFLQGELLSKEQRFSEQTLLVRKQNTEILQLTKEKAELEIAHAKEIAQLKIELAEVRCDDRPCPFRQPPNAYTQAKKGMTKEKYHSQKTKQNDDTQKRQQRTGGENPSAETTSDR